MLELARPLLALGAFFQVVDAVGIVAGGALRGAGDTRWPFAVQATLAWALRLPAVYVFAIWLQGGVFGAWIGELVYVFVLSAGARCCASAPGTGGPSASRGARFGR